MKPVLLALFACFGLAACETYDGPARGGYLAYDGYYDDHYGPIYGGYWNNDVFYYRNLRGGNFRRDDEHHFRREGGDGFHPMHVRGPASGGPHHEDGGRGRGDHGHR